MLFRRILSIALLLAPGFHALQSAGGANGAAKSASAQIEMLTGARMRFVWTKDASDGSDVWLLRQKHKLMGLDTSDGRGEREILSELASYSKPLITPRGNRIVYSDGERDRVFVVNFDGSNRKEIAHGYAAEVWLDPVTGIEWVYVATGERERISVNLVYSAMRRHQIDHPNISEQVWDEHQLTLDSWQLSADGRLACGLFPWPQGGIVDMATKEFQKTGKGCWTSMAPDNSYRSWIFDGGHRRLEFFERGKRMRREIVINGAPGIDGFEVYHPRWTNDVRFFVMTGPYKVGQGGTLLFQGGTGVEVYLGQFDAELTKVEGWVRVTSNREGDFYPDGWVDGQGPVAAAKPPPVKAAAATSKEGRDDKSKGWWSRLFAGDFSAFKTPSSPQAWPGDARGLAFLWEDAGKGNQIVDPVTKKTRTFAAEPRHWAKFGRNKEMDLQHGAFVAEGNVNNELLQACKQSNELTIEALITPGQAKQRGPARIISFSSSAENRNFTLGQEGNSLVLRLRTSKTNENATKPQLRLAKLVARRPQHVVVTYAKGRTLCYVDGRKVSETDDLEGDFRNWTPQQLLFGDEVNGSRNWDGKLEGIALFARALSETEARAHADSYTQRLAARTPGQKVVVQAKLVKTMPTPHPQAIAPYRRGLVAYQYEIEKVLRGELSAPRIAVAHWAILDGSVLPQQHQEGESYRLVIEKYADRPELKGERLIESDDYTLDLYYAAEG